MSPAQELEHLRFVVANQAETIARLERELSIAGQGEMVMFSLWQREVPPGWRCWRIKRRSAARWGIGHE